MILLLTLALAAHACKSRLAMTEQAPILQSVPGSPEARSAAAEDLAQRMQGLETPVVPAEDGPNPAVRAEPVEAPIKSPPSHTFVPVITNIQWVVPGPGLPKEAGPMASNNNVAIARHDGRLFMAWRTSPTHFASDKTVMNIVSSGDDGKTWRFEHRIAMGCDVREPFFLEIGGKLHFYFIQNGTNPLAFEPQAPWTIARNDDGTWTEPVEDGLPGEIPWEFKVRNGVAYRTAYVGNHYDMTHPAKVELRFERSDDGVHWVPVDPKHSVEHVGGSSESAFEFASDGSLWAVTRNEDGDESGFGSMVAHAPAGSPGDWVMPEKSSPDRYDSPRMFRHGDDLYLVARRDVGGPFDKAPSLLAFSARRILNLGMYWLRPKRTALYKVNQTTGRVEHVMDFPSAGDTAFPSIVQTGPDTYLIANYTSPVADPGRSWLHGQISSEGTQIYLLELSFK